MLNDEKLEFLGFCLQESMFDLGVFKRNTSSDFHKDSKNIALFLYVSNYEISRADLRGGH